MLKPDGAVNCMGEENVHIIEETFLSLPARSHQGIPSLTALRPWCPTVLQPGWTMPVTDGLGRSPRSRAGAAAGR